MSDDFIYRHIGPAQQEQDLMLNTLNCDKMSDLLAQVIPKTIMSQRYRQNLLPEGGISEPELIQKLKQYAQLSKSYHSMAGQGFHPTLMPAVIRRNMLEDPSWYSAYTPYQAEISQGRLEMLMNFQQMVQDFTGFECANASLLDEASAAAEVMALFLRQKTIGNKNVFFACDQLQGPILDVMSNRAKSFGIDLRIGGLEQFIDCANQCYGALTPYFDSNGNINQLARYVDIAKEHKICIAAQADILALSVIQAPGKLGFDAAIGNTQRFGVPMSGGGPHAAYMACGMAWIRQLPGRIIGTSVDSMGQLAYRMALQTREQHIRRERATSNICTAQALPANLAAAWAVYYGPHGVRQIASDIIRKKLLLKQLLVDNGISVLTTDGFDTLSIQADSIQAEKIWQAGILVYFSHTKIIVSVNQLTTIEHITTIASCLTNKNIDPSDIVVNEVMINNELGDLCRSIDYLTHPIFNSKHSENKMMRYLKHLANKDLALNSSMISLGSCTMKLNSAAIMEPISWSEITDIHPLRLRDSMLMPIIKDLQRWLGELTGFDTVSLQPNAGSQGELAGLIAIQRYHNARGDTHRDICLIPSSAHGTNPASATLAGLKVRIVDCDSNGNVSLPHLQKTLNQIGNQVSAIMITYPSTHGIFEEDFKAICDAVHATGGMVYLDGANFNAMMGLVQPRYLGADVCHLNLHKTFCIPHGGGGPGIGPVCAINELKEFLPTHRWNLEQNDELDRAKLGTLTMAPEGNAGVLVISWAYIMLMGLNGLRHCAEVAILNANYTAQQLRHCFPILYTNQHGRVAHECIIDIRDITKQSKVTAEDIAKRLIDFGFHAPTMSFPVAGTLMIEPTESEDKEEIERFCLAMRGISAEIDAISSGQIQIEQSPLRNAPHTGIDLLSASWKKPYSQLQAAFPGQWQSTSNKYWPVVRRIDNVAGDRNLQCSCPSMESYMTDGLIDTAK